MITGGQFTILNSRLLKKTTDRIDEVVVGGAYDLGAGSDGLNLAQEEVYFDVAGDSYVVPAGAFRRSTSRWILEDPSVKSGIYSAWINDDGTFILRAKDFSFNSFYQGSVLPIELKLGNDRFHSSLTVNNSSGDEFLKIYSDKFVYSLGETARIFVEQKRSPSGTELEMVELLKVNGKEVSFYAKKGRRAEYRIRMSEPGSLLLEARAYLIDKQQIKALVEALQNHQSERDLIRRRLENGIDDETREQLLERLIKLESIIADIQASLDKNRRPLGGSVTEELFVE